MTSSDASNCEEAMIEPALDTAIDFATSLSILMNSANKWRQFNYYPVTYYSIIFCYVIYSYHIYSTPISPEDIQCIIFRLVITVLYSIYILF